MMGLRIADTGGCRESGVLGREIEEGDLCP